MDDLLKKAMPTQGNIEKVMAACGDFGKADGLNVAVKVLRALAEDGPKVDASEIRAAALSLERSAEGLKDRAQKALSVYKANVK